MDALFGSLAARAPTVGIDYDVPDSSETIHISSLSLLKMLKHGKYFLLASFEKKTF